MPDIKFFEPFRYNADRSTRPCSASETIQFGDWTFTKAKVEVAHEFRGNWFAAPLDAIGFEITYSNAEISQEETDRLFHEYLVLTGQAK